MSDRRTGVFVAGGLGAVSTCVITGIEAIRAGLIRRTGLVTAKPEFEGMGLADPADFVFGGWEIRGGTHVKEAEAFGRENGVITTEILNAAREGLEAATANIRPGVVVNEGEGPGRLGHKTTERDGLSLHAMVEELRGDLREFKKKHRLDTVVVVQLTSIEPFREVPEEFARLETFLKALEENRRDLFSASVIYAVAAMEEGCPYVNFTSCMGSSFPAMDELARREGVPHMGRDGKTGETLMKTVLAPMFTARNFRVLSWEGHNLLGNRDGEVLDIPEHNRAKVSDKHGVLGSILQDPQLQSRVRIDYVPSLGDWKTAWNHIHFEGFLGARMRMQVIWEGCDSSLAAPLAIDLARMAEFAKRSGESGAMTHLACFFKTPYGFSEHSFPLQMEALLDYAESHRLQEKRPRPVKT